MLLLSQAYVVAVGMTTHSSPKQEVAIVYFLVMAMAVALNGMQMIRTDLGIVMDKFQKQCHR